LGSDEQITLRSESGTAYEAMHFTGSLVWHLDWLPRVAGWGHDDHVIGFLERRRRFRLVEGIPLNGNSLDASKGFLDCV
jgi:hypothetical protein